MSGYGVRTPQIIPSATNKPNQAKHEDPPRNHRVLGDPPHVGRHDPDGVVEEVPEHDRKDGAREQDHRSEDHAEVRSRQQPKQRHVEDPENGADHQADTDGAEHLAEPMQQHAPEGELFEDAGA